MSTTEHGSPDPPAPVVPNGPTASAGARRRAAQSLLVVFVALVVAAAAMAFAVSRVTSPAPRHTAAGPSLPTAPASYLGVYEPGAIRVSSSIRGLRSEPFSM